MATTSLLKLIDGLVMSTPTGNPIRPNLLLNSDPACIVFRSLSTSRYLGFVRRLAAGVAG